jgi:hypothetical protein
MIRRYLLRQKRYTEYITMLYRRSMYRNSRSRRASSRLVWTDDERLAALGVAHQYYWGVIGVAWILECAEFTNAFVNYNVCHTCQNMRKLVNYIVSIDGPFVGFWQICAHSLPGFRDFESTDLQAVRWLEYESKIKSAALLFRLNARSCPLFKGRPINVTPGYMMYILG